MWQKCYAKSCDNAEIEYNISDDFFEIKCFSSSPKITTSARLFAIFADEKSFEIGIFEYDNKMCLLNKKYSLSYLENNGIDVNTFSHFLIKTQDNSSYYAFKQEDEMEDLSISRAKELLDSMKKEQSPERAYEVVNNIERRTSFYKKENLSVLPDFIWYKIDNRDEFFGLSSVKHLMQSEGNISSLINGKEWYLGTCSEKRLYAVGSICKSGFPNPFTNADDCAVKFNIPSKNEDLYVVGIMILDDGQYFCRLT